MTYVRAFLLVSAISLAACAHHQTEATSQPSAGAATIYPAGIVPPADWTSATRAGIYSSDDPKTCCFLAGASTLTLDNPAGSQYAVFTFYAPSVAPLTKTRERVSARFNGIAVAPADLAPGMQNITFAIPPSLRQTHGLTASLHMSVTWVPKNIGLNEDRRVLSVMLIRVGYI